jgi:hypothetical protein
MALMPCKHIRTLSEMELFIALMLLGKMCANYDYSNLTLLELYMIWLRASIGLTRVAQELLKYLLMLSTPG